MFIFRHVIRLTTKDKNSTIDSFVTDDPVIVIVIYVDDVNDNYPHFTETQYQVSIREDAPLGYTVAILQAKDNDLAGTAAARLFYGITSANNVGLFRIDNSTGVILVDGCLDYDLGSEVHYLVVVVCDSDPVIPLCTLAQFQVNLDDVNDNSPIFPVSEYLEFIGENEPVGTSIFTARAADIDRGVYGVLNYSIVSEIPNIFSADNNSWKPFSINAKTGMVSTSAILDYEQESHYFFSVRATDTGGCTVVIRVRVDIESRDEFYPQFTERIYYFRILIDVQMLPGTIIGYVSATDRDKGPDGRVKYQLVSPHPLLKINRTTGALMVKQLLMYVDLDSEEYSRLVVSAGSGKQGSLSNTTVVKVLPVNNKDSSILRDTTVLATPTDVGTNTAFAPYSSITDWALGLLVVLLSLIIIIFGSVLIYLHIKNRRLEKPGEKSELSGESNTITPSSCADPNAVDTLAKRNITDIGINKTVTVNQTYAGRQSGQFPPPNYDEIPPYGICGRTGTRSESRSQLSGSDQSCSSGHGSAEDDGEDEEIRMISKSQEVIDSASDHSVPNTQEYLARLGIVDQPKVSPKTQRETRPLENLQLSDDEAATGSDVTTLDYRKTKYPRRPPSRIRILGGPSMDGSLRSIIHSEEELRGSYNWDYLLDWGPQYQPLAHVFSEIARLKDDAASVYSGNSMSGGRQMSIQQEPPPPLLTSVASTSLTVSAMARGMLPRSPISHDISTFPSAALSPSFLPSLSPLATRAPSISPLVPITTLRTTQYSPKVIPISDN